MKISISIGGSALEGDFDQQVQYVREAEKLGVESVWSVEGWGSDAITPLAYLAAKTERIRLGTAIMQASARVPAMTAMTALTLAAISKDRFILGLGTSGPQIVDGLHGVPFTAPLSRLRETVEIIRMAFNGEKLSYQGKIHTLPHSADGKAIRLATPPNKSIPIYVAALGPRSLEFVGAEADGWLGTSFTPEYADALLGSIKKGAEESGRNISDLDIHVGAADVGFGEDPEALANPLRMGRAFTIGGMGSAKTNFYMQAYSRGGWKDDVNEVQRLWLEGKREEAAARVPTEMILQTNLLGNDKAIAERIQAYENAGVTTLKVTPRGKTVSDRLDTLARLLELT